MKASGGDGRGQGDFAICDGEFYCYDSGLCCSNLSGPLVHGPVSDVLCCFGYKCKICTLKYSYIYFKLLHSHGTQEGVMKTCKILTRPHSVNIPDT